MDDPLLKQKPDDIAFVLCAVAGLFFTLVGGYLLWDTIHGELTYSRSSAEDLFFRDALVMSAVPFVGGLGLLAYARRGMKRLARRGSTPRDTDHKT